MKKITFKSSYFLLSLVLFLFSSNCFSITTLDTITSIEKNKTLSPFSKKITDSTIIASVEKELINSISKKKYKIGDPINKYLEQAKELFKAIDADNRIVDFLEPKNIASLPIGVKKTINGSQYMLGISNAKFTPEYTELTAFVRIIIPQVDATGKMKELFFGANNIKLSHKGGLIGDTNLVLLGDVPINIFGVDNILTLKGGMDMATGKIENKTYVTIDCSGFKEFGINAEVKFSQNIMKPVDAENNVIPNKSVSATFQTKASNWNDILVELSLPKFQIASFNGLIFEINKAKIDLSDLRNPTDVNWPANYKQDYLVPGNESLWRGLYAADVRITLPKEFQYMDSLGRITFSAKDLLIDGMGISGIFSANNILDLKDGSAGGWGFSVSNINLGFKANTFVSGGFGGAIILPLSDRYGKCAKGTGVELEYLANINPIDHAYTLRADVNKKLCFSAFKATANIEKGSYVELKVKEGKFLPKALLNGTLTIKSAIVEKSEVTEEDENDERKPTTTFITKTDDPELNKQGILATTETITGDKTTTGFMDKDGNSVQPKKAEADKKAEEDKKAQEEEEEENSKKIILFEGIIFQNLQLQTVTPIIKTDYFGYKNNFEDAPGSSKVANFPLTIHEIALIADDNSATLRVDLSINLMKNQFGGRTKFDLVGKFNEKSGIQKWKFDHVKFERIDLKADIGGAKFEGSITIMDNDPTYGKGFKGSLKAEFKGGIEVSASAIFGKKDNFRYWYVDAMADNLNIPCSAFVIKGFGGGAYYNMKKEGFSSSFTASGVRYVPDEPSSLGIKAMIHFANAARPDAFWGGAGFEIAFNDNGGINRISIYGEGHVMQDFNIPVPVNEIGRAHV